MCYTREIVRSTPHLILDALRRGSPRARLRLSALLSTVALALTGSVAAIVFRDGPPTRLFVDGADAANVYLVNSTQPILLPTRVVDDRGHRLPTDSVRYEWVAGVPATVTRTGVLTCTHFGDVIVRGTLGALASDVNVHCRPVNALRASMSIDFVAGDPPRDIPFVALSPDGHAVAELRGSVTIADTTVATLAGMIVRPRAVGETFANLRVGEREMRMQVIVHEPVASFVGLRPDQPNVAIPVSLNRGDTLTFALPAGTFMFKFLPRIEGQAPPTITLSGPVSCTTGDGLRLHYAPEDEVIRYCFAQTNGGAVTVAHGAFGAPVVAGAIAIDRLSR